MTLIMLNIAVVWALAAMMWFLDQKVRQQTGEYDK